MDIGAALSNLLPGARNAAPQQNTPATSDVPMSPDQPNSLVKEWESFLNQPGNRAAVAQFGVNMLQPIGLGQSFAGHVGQSVGAAGEAKQRVVANEQDKNLKAAQADYYSGRANGGTASALVNQRQEDAAWRQYLSKAIEGLDPVDPYGEAQRMMKEEPERWQQFLQQTQEMWDQIRSSGGDPNAAPTIPASLTQAVQPGMSMSKPITATGPNGQKMRYNPTTKQWENM